MGLIVFRYPHPVEQGIERTIAGEVLGAQPRIQFLLRDGDAAQKVVRVRRVLIEEGNDRAPGDRSDDANLQGLPVVDIPRSENPFAVVIEICLVSASRVLRGVACESHELYFTSHVILLVVVQIDVRFAVRFKLS